MDAKTIHALLLAEGTRVNLPKYYTRDLTFHDLEELEASGMQHFLWCLRTCGTHLINLDPSVRRLGDASAYTLAYACASFGDDEILWYVFTDGALVPVSKERALRLADQACPKGART